MKRFFCIRFCRLFFVMALTIYRDEKEERKTLESTINKGFWRLPARRLQG